MSEQSTKEQHIYRLSSLDQSVSRTYITIALCFPCNTEHFVPASYRWVSAIKRTISHLPILAGVVRPASGRDGTERGFVEVAVSLDMINNFLPNVKHFTSPDSDYIYEMLHGERFPASKVEIEHFALLAQNPTSTGGNAFAAQLNILRGGVIAVFQLHHAVADIASLQTILRFCSTDGRPRSLTHDILSSQAVQSSKSRDLLSDAKGVLPPRSVTVVQPTNLVIEEIGELEKVTCVLGFSVAIIDSTTEMVNDRYIDAQGQARQLPVSAIQVLASILWRAVIRARLTAGLMHLTPTDSVIAPLAPSRISIPVNIRSRMEPELKASYFGNAIASATTAQSITSLGMAISISELQATASLVRTAVDMVTERTVRLAIANAQQSDYTNSTTTTTAKEVTDVTVVSWSDLLPEEAHLTLGLGEPSFVRKLSTKDADECCNIHPRPTEGEIWDVTVTLSAKAMEALLADEGVMKFVKFADGERYVNGVTENMNFGHEMMVQDEHDKQAQRNLWRQGLLTGSGRDFVPGRQV